MSSEGGEEDLEDGEPVGREEGEEGSFGRDSLETVGYQLRSCKMERDLTFSMITS